MKDVAVLNSPGYSQLIKDRRLSMPQRADYSGRGISLGQVQGRLKPIRFAPTLYCAVEFK